MHMLLLLLLLLQKIIVAFSRSLFQNYYKMHLAIFGNMIMEYDKNMFKFIGTTSL